MTVQEMIDRLTAMLASGEIKATDLVVSAEYSRVHLRPAPDGYKSPGSIEVTRETKPL